MIRVSAIAAGERGRAPTSGSDAPFYIVMWLLGGGYVALLGCMLLAESSYTGPSELIETLSRPAIRASCLLTILSSSGATLAALAVAVPLSYLMSRRRFLGHGLIEGLLDIPNILPPLVLGLSLLILFQYEPLSSIAPWVVYQKPAVFVAQFIVAASYATPVLRSTFDHLDPRTEEVALTLGCSRRQAFFRVTLPEARAGMLTAGALAWSRCFGSFGPLLVFAGATRNKTEVLATTVYLELSLGDIRAAVAVSLLMILVAATVLLTTRALCSRWG